jgi:hypothetical protein
MASSLHEKRALVISVNSGGVSVSQAAITHTRATKKVSETFSETILDEHVVPFSATPDESIDHFLESATIALDTALLQLATNTAHPDVILLMLSTPWALSQTRRILYTEEKPFLMTHAFLSDLLQKEVSYVLSHDLEQFGALGSDGVIIEKQVSKIVLNGYETGAPFGHHARELSVSFTISVSPKAIIDRFSQTIRRYYGTKSIAYTTETNALIVSVRDHALPAGIKDAWIVSVGAEVTDLSFMIDNTLSYHHSFPFGTATMIREIAATLHRTESETGHLLQSLLEDTLASTQAAAVEKAFAAALGNWNKGLEELFDRHQYGLCAPATAALLAPPLFRKALADALSGNQFLRHACATQTLDVRTLTPQTFLPTTTATDIHSTIASVFAQRIV